MPVSLSTKVSSAAEKDIRELESRIDRFKNGTIDEEKFKHYRLTRGVYGQRQLGVQMFRIKIPFGQITHQQLTRMADLAEQYASGNLHATTRQNIQFHYVKLDDSPAIWAGLEDAGLTGREACGNTVRTITGSASAGINPKEPFDVSPYAHALSYYFLRNPICQEMGRKFKMAFSATEQDSAFTYFHDLGFIPRIKEVNGQSVRGFKVLIGGGLGAQAFAARPIYEFLEADQLIPFTEAVIRIFDRYGEREKRHKARLKFLLDEKRGLGLEQFLQYVEEERLAIKSTTYVIDPSLVSEGAPIDPIDLPELQLRNADRYQNWLQLNTFEQKQSGFYGVQIKLPLGNIDSARARKLASIVSRFAANDIRITVNQGFLLRFVRPEALPHLYLALDTVGLAEPGFDTIADITACPGSDTCNLAVTNSTNLTAVLEDLIQEEYPELVHDSDIKIKISGCMNSCGQHMAAHIGFHGSSIKKKPFVIPAQQIVIGGGVSPQGEGFIAEKVIKVPTKRIPEALATILDDFIANGAGQNFHAYARPLGKRYFYDLLKPLANLDSLSEADYQDWGKKDNFIPAIGVGECAGVTTDVIATILEDAREKLDLAKESLQAEIWADGIYHAYSSLVVGAKALLLSEDIKCNTQIGILKDFQTHFVDTGIFVFADGFEAHVLRIRRQEPEVRFANRYYEDAVEFYNKVLDYRQAQIQQDQKQIGKQVVQNYYRA
ncbi:MAG: nitrite reductase [Bacteroidota bacterium]